MNEPRDDDFPSLHEMRPPWLGLGLPPLAWVIQAAVNYALVPWLCRWERGTLLIHAVSAVALLLALVGMGLSWHEWRRHGGGSLLAAGSGLHERPRFMALWGLLLGGFLSAVILVQALPGFVVPPCE